MAALTLSLPSARAAPRPRRGARCCAAPGDAAPPPPALSRRSAGALLAGGALLLRGGAAAQPARALVKGSGAAAFRKALLAEFAAADALDYRACLRLLLADVASGGHNGSVRFPEELARPENAGLADTVAALGAAKARLDAKGLTSPLSWTDAISWAARTRTKVAFDAIVSSRAAPGKGELLLKAYGNEFPTPPLGGVDAAAAGPPGGLPAGTADAASWLAAFARLGLKPIDLAFLGPEGCVPGSAAEVEAMLRQNAELASYLDKFAQQKALLTRSSYEVPFARSFAKLDAIGKRVDANSYAYVDREF